jgi:hypothetical protein
MPQIKNPNYEISSQNSLRKAWDRKFSKTKVRGDIDEIVTKNRE